MEKLSDNINTLLRQIPKVDELLAHPQFASTNKALLTNATQQVLTDLRTGILQSKITNIPSADEIASDVATVLAISNRPNLQRVINGTGIILHTNLGRAPLAKAAVDAITNTALGYSNLEYSVPEGKRSSRHVIVEDLLTKLTGAKAAMVVNNNASAVLLALSAVAKNKDVIVSRGELVEIGGSFRVPDVLAQSGSQLVEVGTTNKTHLADYEKAILANDRYSLGPGALLRVHTSNFIISGFTTKPTLEELSALAAEHSLPLIEDLGSGCMIPLGEYGIHGQPTVAESVKAGVDIITFSGDKLLGGPQAGIIVGRKEYIAKMKSHPLARAMRIDKLCLAALEATLRLYLDPKTAVREIPTLQMLCETQDNLFEKAERLADKLSPHATVIAETSQAGGGAIPEENFSTAAVIINADVSAQALEKHFRSGPIPIIGRISKDRFILDVRTLCDDDFPVIVSRLSAFSQIV